MLAGDYYLSCQRMDEAERAYARALSLSESCVDDEYEDGREEWRELRHGLLQRLAVLHTATGDLERAAACATTASALYFLGQWLNADEPRWRIHCEGYDTPAERRW